MKPSRRMRVFAAALALCALLGNGCATCNLPRIDPTGENIFVPGSLGCASLCGTPRVPAPATATVVTPTPTVVAPAPRVQRPLCEAKQFCSVCINPVKIVAPPGAEVVLLGGVCGHDGYLLASERMEWSVAPGSVGHFMNHLERGPFDFVSNLTTAEKVDNTYTVNVTSPRDYVLTRGTPHQTDDVRVEKGQAWVSLTSPIEGTSHVTAYAPGIPTWETRKATTAVYWIDARWAFPPSATNPVGTRHTFTTTVNRHSDGRPAVGYRVRYEIVPGGPAAGFSPSGQQAVEIKTDELGQASVEIFQTQPAPGTNTVNIQIIRPDNLPGVDLSERFVVASGSTQKTWTSPQLSIDKNGPTQAAIGAAVRYTYVIRNPAATLARNVVVTEPVSPNLTLVSSSPQAQTAGSQYEWRVGDVPAGETRTIEANFTAAQPGSVNVCATVKSDDGATSQDCVATTITAPQISLDVTGPDAAQVGSEVTYEILVSNRTAAPANDLIIVDRYEPGLAHAEPSPINKQLGSIAPGETKRVGVTFRVTKPDELYHTVEIQDASRRVLAQRRVGLLATGAPTPTTPSTGQPAIAVTKAAVDGLKKDIGDTALFQIKVMNNGAFPVTGVRVTDSYDPALQPSKATANYGMVGKDIVWQVTSIPPGQTAVFEVLSQCIAANPKACNRVSVTTQQGGTFPASACVEIVQPERKLAIAVVAERDPLTISNSGAFIVTVTNVGQQPLSKVKMGATLSPEALPIEAGTQGPADRTVAGPNVEFQPILNLPPGQSVQYKVAVRGVRQGVATITAGAADDTSVTARTQATINVAPSPGQGAPR